MVSSIFILPLAYSQESPHIPNWRHYGEGELKLVWPSGIAVDSSSDNVYIADTENSRIQVFSSKGTFLAKWGGYGRNDTQMRFPKGVAVDQQENMYVVDTANNRNSALSRHLLVIFFLFSSEERDMGMIQESK